MSVPAISPPDCSLHEFRTQTRAFLPLCPARRMGGNRFSRFAGIFTGTWKRLFGELSYNGRIRRGTRQCPLGGCSDDRGIPCGSADEGRRRQQRLGGVRVEHKIRNSRYRYSGDCSSQHFRRSKICLSGIGRLCFRRRHVRRLAKCDLVRRRRCPSRHPIRG